MKIVNIRLTDGRTVAIDAARYEAFKRFVSDPNNAALLVAQDGYGRDAVEGMAFLVSQLAFLETELFTAYQLPMQYRELVPIDNAAGPWATSIEWLMYDYAGRGRRSSGKGRDIPLVDVSYARGMMPVVHGAVGYDYSMQELRTSAFLGRPIDGAKQAAALDVYQRHMNDVALWGESESNITGLFNNANVSQTTAPNADWLAAGDLKTPAEILSDLNTLIFTIWEATGFSEFPTDIVLPPVLFAHLASTMIPDSGGKTILMWVQENNIAFTQSNRRITFTAAPGLNTAGENGTTRILGYVKNPSRVKMHIPMILQFLDPQREGLDVLVPGEYRYSGVSWRYPTSALYMDGA
jgi:hypothetical protein